MMEVYFIPGFGNGRHWYVPLLEEIAHAYVVHYCPLPGTRDYADTFGQISGTVHPYSFAQSLVENSSTRGQHVWWGHSVGGRIALEAARIDPYSTAAVLLDPNLSTYLPRLGRKWVPPSVFQSRAELETWYAGRGIMSCAIPWGWWHKEAGAYHLVWNADILLPFVEALPRRDIVSMIETTATRLPVIVVKTDALSINGNHQWVRLRKCCPQAIIRIAKAVHHNLPSAEQSRVAKEVMAQLRMVVGFPR